MEPTTTPEANTATTPIVSLSDTAHAKVTELISAEADEALALRVAVVGGGCSGFQYALGFDSEMQDDDIELQQDGVRILVDTVSADYLQGAVVQFHDGLEGKGFQVENPNATGGCGCGKSFSC